MNYVDRHWLALATLLAALSSVWGFRAVQKNRGQLGSNLLLGAAWACQSVFLAERGAQIGHCPLTNLFETVSFLTWSLLLTHLVIGGAYRVSLLGFFTAPVVTVINFFALLAPIDRPNPVPHLGWPLELHASVSLIAYGALGLAAINAFLYLIQEHQLKDHHPQPWFYRFPALGDLARVQSRLLMWGFFLLTVGLGAGLFIGPDEVKLVWSGAVWLIYLLLLLAPRFFGFGPRLIAWCSLASYLFILLTFWGVNFLSHAHRFNV